MDLIHFMAALIGLSFLIFVHELGHFLAAKKVGIRVECFCIGFQPTIFGHRARFFAFKRGETEYALGMVPFGGYVKMAGEELTDEKTGSGDEFGSKGIGERALVLVAGSLMNIIFGMLFFILAFRVGFESESTVVGSAVVGGPAWEAGIQSGDKITAVNGEPIVEYLELRTHVALGGTEEAMTLDIERPGPEGPTEHQIEVTPVKNPTRGIPYIGVLTARTLEVGFIRPGSAADDAGLEPGDVLSNISLVHGNQTWAIPEGISAERTWDLIVSFVQSYPNGAVHCTRERADQVPADVVIKPTVTGEPDEDARPVVGIYQEARMVERVQPKTPAAEVLRAGMLVESINGQSARFFVPLEVLRLTNGSSTATLKMATGESITVATDQLLEWLRGQIVVTTNSNLVRSVTADSPAAQLGIPTGAFLLRVGETTITGSDSLTKALETPRSVEVAWWDGSEKTATLDTATPEFGVDLGAPVTIGFVNDDSPAAKAGLQAGDTVQKVGDTDISSWTSFTKSVVNEIPPSWYELFRKRPYYEAEAVKIIVDRGGSPVELTMTAEVPHGPSLGIGAKISSTNLQSSVADAFVLGPKRGWAWTVRVFMTLKSVIKREVAVKNLSGPVGIFQVGTAASKRGFGWYLFILAVISINLGIFNLLPFPILDGGHLTFLAIEKIKGSPVSERIQIWAFNIAFILLITLALFVTYNDILRLFGVG